ncbi:MAG: ABC transporter ATP-binding protein [Flavobacteriales bacterium]|nr:ABC transporter ATP-binding protein [Flavobacteriales bacterium]MBK7941677.1 ABC transporter ATP-binding protein [Flavobacteriales bacterium]MBK8949296.1 ABC transporter ATP-binding protein [Flavobacteriales bacterium]MBK9700219.1 ABC transporter ATP-binding protein [Flavobacteriales bacterium]
MDSIIFSGVGKRYRSLWALRDVDATFRQGEVVMVIGPNGSGKTTLIKCLLGLVRPTTGSIRVEGQVIGPDPGYRRSIGYMPQISQFPPSLTIGQLLDMMRDVRGLTPASADDGLVEELGLAPQLNKRLGALSGGTMQKVSAVLAFRSRPRILVMDEPTAGLDPVSARTVLDHAAALRSDGGTVLITSHLMEEVEALADRIAYLQEGTLRFLLPLNDVLQRTGADRLALALPKLLADPV